MKKPAHWILLAAFVALLAKLYCAGTTLGTNDSALFHSFGAVISERGLPALYRETPLFNHTPLVSTYASVISDLTGGEPRVFVFLLRLPGILADLGVILLLLRLRQITGRPPWWALALLALSPVSFMVSGYHGNVDSIMVFLLAAAALLCLEGQARLCGLCFALACNIKVLPLLFAPAFFFFWLHRGNARAFFITATATIVAGWAFALLTVPREFFANVLGYSGYWGSWGITYWLAQTSLGQFAVPLWGFTGLSAAETLVVRVLKVIIIGSALTLAWRRRGNAPQEIFATLGLIWIAFFAFAPGLGGQYLVWLGPFLLVLCPASFAVFTTAASISLFIFYNVISKGMPWFSGNSNITASLIWQPWMNLTWFAVVGIFAFHWRAFLHTAPALPLSSEEEAPKPPLMSAVSPG